MLVELLNGCLRDFRPPRRVTPLFPDRSVELGDRSSEPHARLIVRRPRRRGGLSVAEVHAGCGCSTAAKYSNPTNRQRPAPPLLRPAAAGMTVPAPPIYSL
ncbi:hypothetical protein GCM10009863_41310 [Streptomyces axinellae]|uniref:Transposase n=1 Tax=Streptomyces axinellae TaxID=552788 RepID=A0ABN3QCR0_9ACTN